MGRRRSRKVRQDVGREDRHLLQRSRRESQRPQFHVGQQEGECEGAHRRERQREPPERERPAGRALPRDLPDPVRGREWAEVEEEVAARQVLGQQGEREAGQRPQAPRLRVAGQRVERERHPLNREHLDVRELRDPVGREGEEQAGEKGSRRASRELADQQVGAEAAQHERREEHQVVAEDDVPGQCVHGGDLQHLREEVLRVGEREQRRVEEVAAPEPVERVQVPPTNRSTCSAPQARIQQLSRESPVSAGMSEERPRASGQVRASVAARYQAAACQAEPRGGRRKPEGRPTTEGGLSTLMPRRFYPARGAQRFTVQGSSPTAPFTRAFRPRRAVLTPQFGGFPTSHVILTRHSHLIGGEPEGLKQVKSNYDKQLYGWQAN